MGENLSIQSLDITTYDEQGHHWESQEIPTPTWMEIESSIRQLDRFRKPFVHLRLREDTHETHWLSILGGDDAYALTGVLDDERFLNYYDGALGTQEIAIWTSDQGYYPPEKYVCYQIETALKIACYFAKHGQFDPSVEWRE